MRAEHLSCCIFTVLTAVGLSALFLSVTDPKFPLPTCESVMIKLQNKGVLQLLILVKLICLLNYAY